MQLQMKMEASSSSARSASGRDVHLTELIQPLSNIRFPRRDWRSAPGGELG
jgi:hypothetical protein